MFIVVTNVLVTQMNPLLLIWTTLHDQSLKVIRYLVLVTFIDCRMQGQQRLTEEKKVEKEAHILNDAQFCKLEMFLCQIQRVWVFTFHKLDEISNLSSYIKIMNSINTITWTILNAPRNDVFSLMLFFLFNRLS